MGIVYRYQKGEPLTIEEMDGNFKSIEERIEKLEITPFLGEGISKINQEGDRLSFLGTFGTALGCVTFLKLFQCREVNGNPKRLIVYWIGPRWSVVCIHV